MWNRIKRILSGAGAPSKTNQVTPTKRSPSSTSSPRRGRFALPYFQQTTSLAQPPSAAFHFMGEGVSYEAHDLATDDEELQRLGLPVIRDGYDLANAIGFSPQRLRWLAFHSDKVRSCNYFYFTVRKKNGEQRHLAAPRLQIDACARWVLKNILEKIPAHPNAHGFVNFKSIHTNAKQHARQAVVVNLDLTEFFPTIEFRRVRGLFKSFGYSGQVATILALLTTEPTRRELPDEAGSIWEACSPRHLPQGARTSPAISNLICRTLDRRLDGLCRSISWNYTRYADDLTFSCGEEDAKKVGYLLHRVRGIVRDEGFRVKEQKTRVQRRSQAQEVTGLVVNDRAGVPRKELRLIRAILCNASKDGLAAQNRQGRDNFEEWLEGKIGFISQSHPKLGSDLLRQLTQLKKRS